MWANSNIVIIVTAIILAVVLFLLIIFRDIIPNVFLFNTKRVKKSVDTRATGAMSSRAQVESSEDLASLKKEISELKKSILNIETDKERYYNMLQEEKEKMSKTKTSLEKLIEEKKWYLHEEKEKGEILNNELTQLKKQLQELTNERNKIQPSEKTFSVQSLMAAGPRKSGRENELGEDVSGFLTKGDNLFFWVLDGTSDESFIEIDNVGEVFSCRKLAVELSYNLASKAAGDKIPSTSFWIKEAIDMTLTLWRTRLQEYLSVMERRVDSVATFKTTLAAGIWNKKSNCLEAFRIGDSKIIAFNNLGKIPLFREEVKDQVTFQIKRHLERLEVVAFDNSDTIQIETAENLVGLIAFSDGLSKSSQKIISEDFHQWAEIVNNKKQLTHDDKTILVATLVDSKAL